MKKVTAIIMIMLMAFSMFACGGNDNGADGGDMPVYKVVTETTYPPFDTVDDDGNIVGIDMDLMNAIGEDQGFKCEFVDMPFDSLFPAIESGQGDIIAAGMGSDFPGRKEKADFSEPYFTGGPSLLVRIDNETIKGVDTLTPEHKVASQLASYFAEDIQKMEKEGKIKEAVLLPGFDGCMLQLINGDVDAVLADYAVISAYMKQHEGKTKIVGGIEYEQHIAFAVKKGNKELLDKINTGLANLKENGKYDEIMDKWI